MATNQQVAEALEKAGQLIEQMAQAIQANDEYGDFAVEIEQAEEFAGELQVLAVEVAK